MNSRRKQRISDAFGAAADHYDDHAGPQRLAAMLVADLAARQHRGEAPRILEIGCGTGLLTRELRRRWPSAELVVTDIAPAMVERAARGGMIGGTFLAMDGEAPAFEGEWFDLILSSLAFQWFDDATAAVERLAGLLRPGGSLIFSTMAERSFAGWRAAHAACGLHAGTPAYPTLDALRATIAGWEDAFAFDEDYAVAWGGARALLTHLKGIGATVAAEGRVPLTPGQIRAVMAAFEAAGARADYHVAFVRVTRPDRKGRP